MRKLIILGATLSALVVPTTSMAHSDTIIAAAIGGATGAAIGSSMGGRPVYQRVYYTEEPIYWRHRKHHRHHHDDDYDD